MENKDFWIGIIAGLISVGAAIYGAYRGFKEARESNELVKVRIEQAESKARKRPEKAKPAWDVARITLEAYFNRNLSQINYIFWLSVIVMLIGFATVTWGLWMAFRESTTIIPAAIASGAGIITEFIGATFLFIYRSTVEQAVQYSKTLERINSVGMAMQILDTMGDEVASNDLKSQTKSTLVALLVHQAYTSTNISEPNKKASSKTE